MGEHFHVIVAEDGAPLQLAYRRILPPDISRDLLSGPSQGCAFIRFENERIYIRGDDADETSDGEERRYPSVVCLRPQIVSMEVPQQPQLRH